MSKKVSSKSKKNSFLSRKFIAPLFIVIVLGLFGIWKLSDSSALTSNKVSKVIVFVEENHSIDQMKKGMPYAYSQAQKYGYATNYKAYTHPSLPNYIVMAAGKSMGIKDDKTPSSHKIKGSTVFGNAVNAKKTAKIYADGMKSNCRTTDSGRYKARHNPWTYFVDERQNCNKYDVPFASNFDKDAKYGKLPTIGMVIPDNCNNAHDKGCTLGRADSWFKQRMQAIYASPDWKSGKLAVILTADEDDKKSSNTVLTVVLHPSINKKVVKSTLTHFSLSRLLSEVSGTPPLRDAKSAPSMLNAFKLSPVGR